MIDLYRWGWYNEIKNSYMKEGISLSENEKIYFVGTPHGMMRVPESKLEEFKELKKKWEERAKQKEDEGKKEQ